MPSVRLDFVPPTEEGITKLIISEAASQGGPFSEVETVTEIGQYPNYISSYTSDAITAADWWFVIQWEDSKGAQSDISDPIQGGTSTVINDLVNRVMLRDASISEPIIAEEAESVLFDVYGVNPYTIDEDTIDYKAWRGLTNLTLAKCYLTTIYQTGRTTQYVAGLVSEKIAPAKDLMDLVGRLLKEASSDLGIGGSTIAQIVDLSVADGAVPNTDISRLLISME